MAERKTIQTDESVSEFIDSIGDRSKRDDHKYSGGCLHVARLADVDAEVLALMVKNAFRAGSGPC